MRLFMGGLALLLVAAGPAAERGFDMVQPSRPVGAWRVETIRIWDQNGVPWKQIECLDLLFTFSGGRLAVGDQTDHRAKFDLKMRILQEADQVQGWMDIENPGGGRPMEWLYRFSEGRLQILCRRNVQDPRLKGFGDLDAARLYDCSPSPGRLVQPLPSSADALSKPNK